MTAEELKRLEAKGLTVISRFGAQDGQGSAEAGQMVTNSEEMAETLKSLPKHKFSAQADTRQGHKFQSKLEARYYDACLAWQRGGALLFFLRQVPFHIPGGVYRLDFLEFWADGRILATDPKGFETAEFRRIRRIVEACYPVKIRTARPAKGKERGDWVFSETA